jgi:hypothetical protein
MKKILALSCALMIAVAAKADSTQDTCYTDSVVVVSNSADWTIHNTSMNFPSGVPASIISNQYNAIPGFPAAKWISPTTSWIHNTNIADPDDSTTFRYSFRICKKDSVRFRFTIRRDNYCRVYLDGNLWMSDSVTANTYLHDVGTVLDTTILLDICDHNLDIVVYNRNLFTGGNGYGMIMAGYMKSKNKSFLKPSSECAQAACCVIPTGIDEIQKEQVRLFPNPVNDVVTIDLGAAMTKKRNYRIYDAYGRTLIQSVFVNPSLNNISLKGFTPGMYFLQIDGIAVPFRIVKK